MFPIRKTQKKRTPKDAPPPPVNPDQLINAPLELSQEVRMHVKGEQEEGDDDPFQPSFPLKRKESTKEAEKGKGKSSKKVSTSATANEIHPVQKTAPSSADASTKTSKKTESKKRKGKVS
ncbi:hypothetical protein HDU76_004037, partial [Blyttiomyces sp. JEL0837]